MAQPASPPKGDIIGYIKLQVPRGKATASPPIGPALAQYKVNIMEFCKEFNARTQGEEVGVKVPVVITVYKGNKFSFIIKKPPVTHFLLKAAGIGLGSPTAGRAFAGKITMPQIEQIAKEKMKDMNTHDLKSACSMIVGSARSMGLEIIES